MTRLRPGALGAPGRLAHAVVALLVAAACQPAGAPAAPALRATETIIGRAMWRGQEMLLTDAPAVAAIDRTTGRLVYTPIAVPAEVRFAPWGLAESGGALFTISGFSRLMRIDPAGAVSEIAALDRPVANLIDLPDGMAAQLSSEGPGDPLVVRVSETGRLSDLVSPAREALGLSPAEESLLHLLACSAPSRVVCWLPNSNQLLEVRNGALVHAAFLQGLRPIPAATLIADLDRRIIIDAVVAEDGMLVVLHQDEPVPAQQITVFQPDGRRIASSIVPEPLRLLVASRGTEVLAISRAGLPARLRRP